MGTTEVIYYAVGFGVMALGAGAWRARAARRQRWVENESWRDLMVRLDRERTGSLG